MRLIPASLILTAGLSIAAETPDPAIPQGEKPAPAAASKKDAMAERIAQLETEMRSLVAEQAKDAGLAGAAAAPDYTDAKARAQTDVRRRLDIVEYQLADNDYNRAVDACNAILRDHPHEPATVRLKYRILMAMVERERGIIERNRLHRAEEALGETQGKDVIPADKPAVARKVWLFDETIEESDRAQVRKRLQQRITFNGDGVPVGEVLKPFFSLAGINYVILDRALSDDKLTLHLVDDTIENALSTIAKLVNVKYNYSANTVFIGAADSDVMVNEIIHLQSGLTDVLTETPLPLPTITAQTSSGNGGPITPPAPQGNQQQNQNQPMVSDLERF
ncbi:MAG: DUF4974 domain-containing protein, partial [Planctomycetota bacterium]